MVSSGRTPVTADFVQVGFGSNPLKYCYRHGAVVDAIIAYPGCDKPEGHAAWMQTPEGKIHDEAWIKAST